MLDLITIYLVIERGTGYRIAENYTTIEDAQAVVDLQDNPLNFYIDAQIVYDYTP